MRAFHSTTKVGRGVFTSKNISGRCNVATKLFIPTTSMRWQTSNSNTVKPPLWTAHTLSSSTPALDNLAPSSLLSKSKDAKHLAYIALGSNLGDRIGWIEKACNEMSARGIKVKRTSCLWETEPMYVVDQDSFVNGACEVSFRRA